jgi:hypothetical protein
MPGEVFMYRKPGFKNENNGGRTCVACAVDDVAGDNSIRLLTLAPAAASFRECEARDERNVIVTSARL